jgi:AcrR family transcriptional regulator
VTEAQKTSPLSVRAVASVLVLLEAKGVEALTLRAVARQVGVTHRAVAKQTGGFGGLLAASAAAVLHRFDQVVDDTPDCGVGGPGAFRAMGRAYIAFARSHPEWIRLLSLPAVTGARTPELVAARRLFYDRMVIAIADGQARGVLRAGPVTPIASFAWTAVQGFVLVEHALADVSEHGPDARAEAFLDSVFLGIRALGDPGWWPESVVPHSP